MDLVRADFALIPGDPLFSAVIAASQAITDEYRKAEALADLAGRVAATDPELARVLCRDSVSRLSRFRSVRMSAAC